ncbi:MAG TPA: GDSL-type esterase/lipase family protein [Vicinamibacterales bacterium]|nr:GDSL-type esterase/lipase family protein [Vicinamibacterales bacterium]
MPRSFVLLALACTVLATGCSGYKGPNGPTPNPPRISKTRFLAFGDSFTAGEVTNPGTGQLGSGSENARGGSGEWGTQTVHKLILVPTASYPTVLESQLRATYTSQSATITVQNSGEPSERILDGAQRFSSVFDASHAEVVLLMEGANGLPQVGPDISTGLMRIMVQTAKNGGARVFVGSMIPQVAGRPRATTPVSETLAYNNVLQIMSTQESVTYVDLYNPMLADAATLIGSDGLHPTEAGYRKIADLFFAAIRGQLEQR